MRAYQDYSKLQRINIKKRWDSITKPTFPSNNFVDCLSARPCHDTQFRSHGIFLVVILFRKSVLRDNVLSKSLDFAESERKNTEMIVMLEQF